MSIRQASSVMVAFIFAAALSACSNQEGSQRAISLGEEIGPLPLLRAIPASVEPGKAAAFRLEAFAPVGATNSPASLRVTARGRAAWLKLEGPLGPSADTTPVGSGPLVAEQSAEGGEAEIAVALPRPGLYRLVVGSEDREKVWTRAVCPTGCERPEMSAPEFLQILEREGRRAPLLQKWEELLAQWISPSPELKTLVAELKKRLESPNLASTVARFPLLGPPDKLGRFRNLLAGLETPAPSPVLVLTAEDSLEARLAPCVPARPSPRAIDPRHLPGVTTGHFSNLTLAPCEVARSEALAAILNALASANGSRLRVGEKTVATPAELFQALLASGHRIETRNERTFADFLAIGFHGTYVRWPVWIDSGIVVGGQTIKVPSGHSQFAWYVTGPKWSARVAFFLGVSGIGFFPLTSERPGWTGNVALRSVSSQSPNGTRYVLATVSQAAALLRHVRGQRAVGGPLRDGYGVLGICNDSSAAVEIAVAREMGEAAHATAYPLLRSSAVDEMAPVTPIARALKALPKDAEPPGGDLQKEPYRTDALCRLLSMTPMPLPRLGRYDGPLRDQLIAVRKQVPAECYPFREPAAR